MRDRMIYSIPRGIRPNHPNLYKSIMLHVRLEFGMLMELYLLATPAKKIYIYWQKKNI